MKYIIIGLGYFGTSLATELSTLGHEVIGIDNRPERAEELKDKITKVLIMDSTKPEALLNLPLSDIDAVIVAIGEDVGASILTLSILKKLNIKRLLGRAISPIHQNILNELGIEEIIHPEVDTAMVVASMLQLHNAVNILQLNSDTLIAEIRVPSKYIGHTLETIDLEKRFDLKLVAVKIAPKERNGFMKILKSDFQIDLEINKQRPIRDKDILVVLGNIEMVKRFCE